MSIKQIKAKIRGNLNTMYAYNSSIYRTQADKIEKMHYFAKVNWDLSELLRSAK